MNTETEDSNWEEVKQKLKIGDAIEGVVVHKAPFGDFIDIGVGFYALLLLPEMSDLTPKKYKLKDYTPVGSIVKARIIDFTDWNKQIRVTQKQANLQ